MIAWKAASSLWRLARTARYCGKACGDHRSSTSERSPARRQATSSDAAAAHCIENSSQPIMKLRRSRGKMSHSSFSGVALHSALQKVLFTETLSQSEPHPSPRPRDPWKSWKKPHNLRTIPWTAGNPGKNLTICGPSPGPPEILEKNLTILRICLVGCWLVEFRQAVQRPPAGAKRKSY